jgi:hypothetical protein
MARLLAVVSLDLDYSAIIIYLCCCLSVALPQTGSNTGMYRRTKVYTLHYLRTKVCDSLYTHTLAKLNIKHKHRQGEKHKNYFQQFNTQV